MSDDDETQRILDYKTCITVVNEHGPAFDIQCGGELCNHRILHGLPRVIASADKENFSIEICRRGCLSIDEDIADQIDAWLETINEPWRVDRLNLGSSTEAFVYLRLGDQEAVLTWCNCD